MKFCSVVSEELRWQTVWRTDGRTDEQDKNNMSPQQSGGRHNYQQIYTYTVKSVVTFGTKKRWSFKTGDLLKKVQFIWHFLWQDKKKMTF